MNNEKVLYDSTPSMFRNRPFLFILCIIAIFIGLYGIISLITEDSSEAYLRFFYYTALLIGVIGLLILKLWWLRIINTRISVTAERVCLRKGILSKKIREVQLSDIRSVQIDQRLMQRIFGTGTLEIASAGTAEPEITIDGIPNAYTVKDIIDEYRDKHK